MNTSLKKALINSFEQHLDLPALLELERSYSYLDVRNLVEDFKGSFVTMGIGSGETIAIVAEKSAEVIALMLAAVALDVIYVPIDPHGSAKRAAKIVRNAGIPFVLGESSLINSLNIELGGSSFSLRKFTGLSLQQNGVPFDGLNEALFVLHTSGSTGDPKGVLISEANLMAFADWCQEIFEIRSSDVIGSIAPLHFDLSLLDVYAGLMAGATIRLFSSDEVRNPRLMTSEIHRCEVSLIYATPSFYSFWLRFGKIVDCDIKSIRMILFAGEEFPIPRLRALRELVRGVPMYNLYGPTESNVVTYHRIPDDIPLERKNPYPIGRACPYAQLAIMKNGHIIEVTNDIDGELLISGESLSAGYISNRKAGKLEFVVHNDMRWYHTGDMVKADEDGNLIFLGRNDRMIKRNGNRIELGEIESILLQHQDICQAVVLFGRSEDKEKMVGIVSLQPGKVYKPMNLKLFLIDHLPTYMLPDHFYCREDFPFTSNQKIDFQQLQSEYFD